MDTGEEITTRHVGRSVRTEEVKDALSQAAWRAILKKGEKQVNYIPKVAEVIGLKIGERFRVKLGGNETAATFWFVEDGLMYDVPKADGMFTGYASKQTLVSILNGEYEVVKLPWFPKIGEGYWCVLPSCDPEYPRTALVAMNKSVFSMINLHLGNYYQTQEEAEADKKRFIKALKDCMPSSELIMIFGKEAARER